MNCIIHGRHFDDDGRHCDGDDRHCDGDDGALLMVMTGIIMAMAGITIAMLLIMSRSYCNIRLALYTYKSKAPIYYRKSNNA